MYFLIRPSRSTVRVLCRLSHHSSVTQLLTPSPSLSRLSLDLSSLELAVKSPLFYRSLISDPRLTPLLNADENASDFFRSLLTDIEVHSDRETSIALKNDVVERFVGRDFSLVYALKGSLAAATLAEVLRHNPGRAKTSWDLYLEHNKVELGPHAVKVFTLLLNRLLEGEAHEQRDLLELKKTYRPSPYNLSRAIAIVRMARAQGVELDVAPLCAQLLAIEGASLFPLVEPKAELLESLLLNTTAGFQGLYRYYQEQTPTPASSVLLKAVTVLANPGVEPERSAALVETAALVAELGITVPEAALGAAVPETEDLFETVVAYIRELKLDQGSTPEALAFRLALLKSLGFAKRDFRAALDLFTSQYIIRERYHMDVVQAMVLKICCFQALVTNQPVLLQVAHSYQNVTEGMLLSDLQAMIVAHAQFDVEKSLDLYNEYIQTVSRDGHEGALSSATKLTEALITAYLSTMDKEFAYLIHDGAITNGVIRSEADRAHLKRLFKAYGQLITEENETDPAALKALGQAMRENYVERLA